MSADKHDLLARVTQGEFHHEVDPETGRHEIIADGPERVAVLSRNRASAANAELFTLAYGHALLLRAQQTRVAVVHPINGTLVAAEVVINDDHDSAVECDLDAAGCPLLTDELRAALRKAVGL